MTVGCEDAAISVGFWGLGAVLWSGKVCRVRLLGVTRCGVADGSKTAMQLSAFGEHPKK